MNLPAHQEHDLGLVDDGLARVYRRAFQKLGGKCRFDGARDHATELANMKNGTSKLKDPYHSKHVIGPMRPKATAIDVYPTGHGLDLNDPHTYDPVRSAMKQAALEEGVAIFNGAERWGGFDNPHFQLEGA